MKITRRQLRRLIAESIGKIRPSTEEREKYIKDTIASDPDMNPKLKYLIQSDDFETSNQGIDLDITLSDKPDVADIYGDDRILDKDQSSAEYENSYQMYVQDLLAARLPNMLLKLTDEFNSLNQELKNHSLEVDPNSHVEILNFFQGFVDKLKPRGTKIEDNEDIHGNNWNHDSNFEDAFVGSKMPENLNWLRYSDEYSDFPESSHYLTDKFYNDFDVTIMYLLLRFLLPQGKNKQQRIQIMNMYGEELSNKIINLYSEIYEKNKDYDDDMFIDMALRYSLPIISSDSPMKYVFEYIEYFDSGKLQKYLDFYTRENPRTKFDLFSGPSY